MPDGRVGFFEDQLRRREGTGSFFDEQLQQLFEPRNPRERFAADAQLDTRPQAPAPEAPQPNEGATAQQNPILRFLNFIGPGLAAAGSRNPGATAAQFIQQRAAEAAARNQRKELEQAQIRAEERADERQRAIEGRAEERGLRAEERAEERTVSAERRQEARQQTRDVEQFQRQIELLNREHEKQNELLQKRLEFDADQKSRDRAVTLFRDETRYREEAKIWEKRIAAEARLAGVQLQNRAILGIIEQSGEPVSVDFTGNKKFMTALERAQFINDNISNIRAALGHRPQLGETKFAAGVAGGSEFLNAMEAARIATGGNERALNVIKAMGEAFQSGDAVLIQRALDTVVTQFPAESRSTFFELATALRATLPENYIFIPPAQTGERKISSQGLTATLDPVAGAINALEFDSSAFSAPGVAVPPIRPEDR